MILWKNRMVWVTFSVHAKLYDVDFSLARRLFDTRANDFLWHRTVVKRKYTFPISEKVCSFCWQAIRIRMSFNFIMSFIWNIRYRFERTFVIRVQWMKLTPCDFSIELMIPLFHVVDDDFVHMLFSQICN